LLEFVRRVEDILEASSVPRARRGQGATAPSAARAGEHHGTLLQTVGWSLQSASPLGTTGAPRACFLDDPFTDVERGGGARAVSSPVSGPGAAVRIPAVGRVNSKDEAGSLDSASLH